MTQWRLVLAFVALVFIGFGFAFLYNPVEMAAIASITLPTPAARTDVRAMYGGLEFGVGVFLLLCALRREFVRIGLFAAACALVSMATARSVGLLLDGFTALQFIIALTEWVGGGLVTWGALVTRPGPDALPPPVQDLVPDDPVRPLPSGQGRKNE
jgi:hypothetical protein